MSMFQGGFLMDSLFGTGRIRSRIRTRRLLMTKNLHSVYFYYHSEESQTYYGFIIILCFGMLHGKISVALFRLSV